MLRLVLFLITVALFATGLSWLADRPGSIVIDWQGYEIETSVFRAIVMLTLLIGISILAWSALSYIWLSPAALGRFFNRRRQERGLDALSSGMIAVGAGDRSSATRYAVQARKTLPNEPLTYLLRAQAAQLSGDRITARRIFEAMLASPETEQLGLRGLFLEAEREGEREAAQQFAERAVRLNPKLGWPLDALFELQCKDQDWTSALETLAIARRHGHIDRAVADRRRAVLLTARAQELEELDPERALQLAIEANGLAADLVPATAIAGRLLAARGNTPRATRIIARTWRKAQHPDLATAYAYARLGDSPRDRLDRVRQLASLAPNAVEAPIAIATAAIEAHEFEIARQALQPLTDHRMTQRVCTLMARVEGEQNGDKGRVREWLARAVHAPRDPAWTADGIVSDRWLPVSPVTGALDAFQYRVPVEGTESADGAMLAAQKLDDLVRLANRPEPVAHEQGAAPAPANGTVSAPPASGTAAVRDNDRATTVRAEPVAPADLPILGGSG
jgi:HemY protein